jgi:hypothetical protein
VRVWLLSRPVAQGLPLQSLRISLELDAPRRLREEWSPRRIVVFSQGNRRVYSCRPASRSWAAFVLFALSFSTSAFAQGLVESATGNAMRPKFSAGDVRSSRGRFTFPSPYNTEAVRLTEASDCNGSDCVRPVGYAYWSNINNHVGSSTMLIFLSLKDNGGPTLFSYNKNTGETLKRGALFAGDNTFGWAPLATGEGWYFSGTRPNALYINEPMGSRLFRYDVINHTWETVFDMSGQFPNKYLWQVHSSTDDRVHSFTVRDKGSYTMEGCAIYREDQRKFVYYARKGNDLDECQIDKSGRWLVIKEQIDGAYQEDNRVIDVESNTERVLYDQDGAAGHSDVGYGYMVAEDNFNNRPSAVRVWDFNKDLKGGEPASPVAGQGTLVYHMAEWTPLAQHIAHGNSKPGTGVPQQVACASNGSDVVAPRINEIVCFKLDGSLEALVVAPTLTDVNAAGSGGTDGDKYWKYPKGNLDITGEYFIWTTNGGTNRLDAFMVKVPLNRLGASGSGAPPPANPGSQPPPPPPPSTPAPESSPAPAPQPNPPPAPSGPGGSASPVSWTEVVNATTMGNTLTKAGGCSGCPDAGAVSAQSIVSGDGYVEFTVPETGTLRFIGLSSGNGGTDPSEIKFALRLQGGNAEVRESGAYRTETSFSAGDVLRVAYAGGTIQYSKNGAVFYTSGASPAYPAIVDTTLFDDTATLWNVMIGATGGPGAAGPSGASSAPPSESQPPSQASGPVAVVWTSESNVSANGNNLTKAGGCGGCPDAGAISAQQIAGEGYVEFSAAGSGLRFIGLGAGNSGTSPTEIMFALRLQGSTAEVREAGAYRSEVGISGGDTLRIAITGGKVEYSKNGSVFYVSSASPAYPAVVDTSLFDGGASISNVMISGVK